MSHIFLIRHAQSEANLDKSLYAAMHERDIPLSKYGEKQAVECGIKLARSLSKLGIKQTEVVSSTYLRAKSSAEIATETLDCEGVASSRITEDSRIRELDHLLYELRVFVEGLEWMRQNGRHDVLPDTDLQNWRESLDFALTFPGIGSLNQKQKTTVFGESIFELNRRTHDFAKDCKKIVSESDCLLIFSHVEAMNSLLGSFMVRSFKSGKDRIKIPNSSIYHLQFVDGNYIDNGFIA